MTRELQRGSLGGDPLGALTRSDVHTCQRKCRCVPLSHLPQWNRCGWTTIGPVLEVRIVKILEDYGIEIAIPSIAKPANTSRCDMKEEQGVFSEWNS